MGRLLEAIHAVPPVEESGEGCLVRTYLNSLPSDDAEDLRQALTTKIGDRYVASAARISVAMSQNGKPLSATLINGHRARTCRCYRKVVTDG